MRSYFLTKLLQQFVQWRICQVGFKKSTKTTQGGLFIFLWWPKTKSGKTSFQTNKDFSSLKIHFQNSIKDQVSGSINWTQEPSGKNPGYIMCSPSPVFIKIGVSFFHGMHDSKRDFADPKFSNMSLAGPKSKHWNVWPLQEPSRLDTSGKYWNRTYLKKVLVTTTGNDFFCPFYLWLHPFHLHLNLNAFFDGGIFLVYILLSIKAWL